MNFHIAEKEFIGIFQGNDSKLIFKLLLDQLQGGTPQYFKLTMGDTHTMDIMNYGQPPDLACVCF